jgi:hypothetical protein
MGVDDVRAPGANEVAEPTGGGQVPVGPHADPAGGEAGGAEAVQERGIGRGDDQRFVPVVALAAREQEHLSLAAAPFPAAVDVEDPE